MSKSQLRAEDLANLKKELAALIEENNACGGDEYLEIEIASLRAIIKQKEKK